MTEVSDVGSDVGSAAVVAVVGGGASGALTAMQIARQAIADGRAVRLVVVEPADLAEGLAYSTRDLGHRLNVRACGMSAYPDRPDHFVDWLRRHVSADHPGDGFASRHHFGQYLAQCLADAALSAPGVRLEHVRARVEDIAPDGERMVLTLDDGTTRHADAVVLATGHGDPSTSWAPTALRKSHRFVADPWRGSAAPVIRPGETVLLVGAGLTMADMVQRWHRRGVRCHVTSRHGMRPLAHAARGNSPDAHPPLPTARPVTLAGARRLVFEHIRAYGGDWRCAIDSLRPITARLWAALPAAARADFVASAARRWDRARHRIDPDLADWLDRRCADGSVTVHEGAVTSAVETPTGMRVGLADGTVVEAAAVLNCTGTQARVDSPDDPLAANLRSRGIARPGPLGLGLATDEGGRLVGADGTRAAIWAIGPLRRGELWESTAIPEIRCQAAGIAREIVDALPLSVSSRPASATPGSGVNLRALPSRA